MKKKYFRKLVLLLLIVMLTACGKKAAPDREEPVNSQIEESQSEENVTVQSTEASVFLEDEDADEIDGGDFHKDHDSETEDITEDSAIPEYGKSYYDLEHVVLYLTEYNELPPNYITKEEARELGWEGGSVEDYKAGAAIGGDRFGNREGLLPEADGRSYTECDIDTDGYGSRGSRRLVFSNDGLFFYTSDHYESFSEVTVTEDYEVVW